MALVALGFQVVALVFIIIQDRRAGRNLEAARQQLNDVLARVATEPRLELRAAPVAPVVDPQERRYISDEPYMDAAWNEFRGATQDAPVDES